jgi:SRSO17 transposase
LYSFSYAQYFVRGKRSVFEHCQNYLKGLFHECKSNIERMSERIPGSDYQNLHHFISHSAWDGLAVMGEVARQTAKSFGLLPAARRGLLLDESGWEKSGRESVGVSRQYIGNVGKVCNAQVGVFAALVQEEYVGLVSSRLFLPCEWTNDSARCASAGVPAEAQVHRTKCELAVEMLKALPAEVGFDWVGGDSVYGNSPVLRQFLVEQKLPFVLDVGHTLGVYLSEPQAFIPEKQGAMGRNPSRFVSQQKPVSLQQLLHSVSKEQWQQIEYRQGTKGALRREAVLLDVWLWAPENGTHSEALQVLISRELNGSEVKFSLCWQPEPVKGQSTQKLGLATALYQQMQRYWVERAFQDVKEQLGMHQYQVRSYMAWYHHIALTMMALHFILHTRIEQKDEIPMLSCPDVKLMLAKKLQNKLNDPHQALLAMFKRQQQRIADKLRYYLRI